MDQEGDRFPLHTAARLGQRKRIMSIVGWSRPITCTDTSNYSQYRRGPPTSEQHRFVTSIDTTQQSAKQHTNYQADPKLSKRKDDDGRYPIHWAASSNSYDIVLLLANQSSFDPDVQVPPS
jgi:26S proteasome non-ATPase regulatory subunit 10